jgi:(p)ppGpp synthase/HD superfamily hydrolase
MYATHVHGGQLRKRTNTPYVAHLPAVAATVLEYGGDEDLAIAALLHDTVEDQGGRERLEDVRNRFGERVARIVEACSDSLADAGKGERKAHWRERKEA